MRLVVSLLTGMAVTPTLLVAQTAWVSLGRTVSSRMAHSEGNGSYPASSEQVGRSVAGPAIAAGLSVPLFGGFGVGLDVLSTPRGWDVSPSDFGKLRFLDVSLGAQFAHRLERFVVRVSAGIGLGYRVACEHGNVGLVDSCEGLFLEGVGNLPALESRVTVWSVGLSLRHDLGPGGVVVRGEVRRTLGDFDPAFTSRASFHDVGVGVGYELDLWGRQ